MHSRAAKRIRLALIRMRRHAGNGSATLRSRSRAANCVVALNGYHEKPASTAARSAGVAERPRTSFRCGKRPKRAIIR